MKKLIIVASLLLTVILGKAQAPEKKLPITFTYEQGIFALSALQSADSLISASLIPISQAGPTLKKTFQAETLIRQIYALAVKADTVVKPKKKTK